MPRKPKQLPLAGLTVAIAGSFPGITQAAVQQNITSLGASVSKSVTADTTCLIATQTAVDKAAAKVVSAQQLDVPIVSIQWLDDCESSFSLEDMNSYAFSSSKGKKRAVSPAKSLAQSPEPVTKKQKVVPKFGEGSITKSRNVTVPLDEGCSLASYQVYIDDDGVIYDASLNQTNASNNNNKFYRIQLVHDRTRSDYKTWTRWGRVGEHGQNAVLGGGSLAEALKHYEKKFKDKSGIKWDDRAADPKAGKYAYVERSYAPDTDDESDEHPTPESTLPVAVQSLMQLIFNQQYINTTMSDLNYDASKMPLGKLSKATIHRGFQTLNDLADLIQNSSSGGEIEELSNRYYSLIPHDFGRNRPTLIRDMDILKIELGLLESLGDLKEAEQLMKGGKGEDHVHPLDRQFQGLGLDEMTVIDPDSKEYEELATYLNNSRGKTHGLEYEIDSIFRIERNGEYERFQKSEFSKINSDRRLLWHGSRATNFGGILSQGLRIAPPEAPASGYMFGKGIYLADMSSKSANYCVASSSGNNALLLLCEAELGNPLQELTDASYDADITAKEKGSWSTWGQGMMGPSKWKDARCVHPSLKGVQMPDMDITPGDTNIPNAYLYYNEYIAYNVAQVRLRYLFRVKM